MAYGIHQLEGEPRFLVFDQGAGTFNVSVQEIFEGVIGVRTCTGDNRLGGEDLNGVLAGLMETADKGLDTAARNDRQLVAKAGRSR